MGVKRKQHSAKFKVQLSMVALAGNKTLAQLSSDYGLHVTMISTWKRELLRHFDALLERGNKRAAVPQTTIDESHRKIAQLQAEGDFLVGQPAICRLMKVAR